MLRRMKIILPRIRQRDGAGQKCVICASLQFLKLTMIHDEQRVARRVESSDDDSDAATTPTAKRRASVDVHPKKRARTSSTQQPRRASSAASSSAAEDKLRKFAVDDFTKMLTKIFETYPYLREGEEEEMADDSFVAPKDGEDEE